MIHITTIDINFIITEILRLLPFFIPLIIIEYGLMIYAIVQLARNEVAYLPKWGWALIIIFINIIGPVVFLIVGKKKEIEND
ncbi:MAG: PLDc N-terminal domain-containing protein [Candidatus Hydromicrobium sp.]|nr:PLDc N-terminal domain-containing protein [Candidatus Hydromicrobium sp.]